MTRPADRVWILWALASCLGLFGCQKPADTPPPDDAATPADRDPTAEPTTGGLALSSPAFTAGEPIPAKYTGDGDDVSPPLQWSGVPDGVASWAVICDDPDAPSPRNPRPDPWVHWVAFNIEAAATALAENASADPPLAPNLAQGQNSWPADNLGYRGPAPPPGSGTHRYFFKLYALDTTLDLDAAATTKQDLLAAMEGHILASAELMGTFERQKP